MPVKPFDAVAAGRKLRDLRGNRPLHEVADAVGVAAMTLSQYERGQRVPKDQTKMKLAAYYKMTVADIFFS